MSVAPGSLPPVALHEYRTPLRHTLALWGMAVFAFCFFEGARWLTTTESGLPGGPGSVPTPAAPMVVPSIEVRAILQLPSPTATSTPRPTVEPTADPRGSLDFCGTREAGLSCQVPWPPPPTPTPFPACEDVIETPTNGGVWCAWGSPEVVTR